MESLIIQIYIIKSLQSIQAIDLKVKINKMYNAQV